MRTIEEIENAIRCLSAEDLSAFRSWFVEFDGDQWDRQIKEDVKAGRLDEMAEQALRDLREGRCTDL